MTIADFNELNCPEQDGAENDGKDWVTFHKAKRMVYYFLRNDGSNRLIDLRRIRDNKDIYFDTELECHAAAALYYHHHNEIYPYWKEYTACVKIKEEQDGKPVENGSTTIHSEVMEF